MAASTGSTINPWKVGQSYAAGDLVTYNGVTYQALQSATSIETWNPVAAAALWSVVSGTPTPAPAPSPTTATGDWSASSVYTQGMTVTIDGVTYRANWWTQGSNPQTSNGASGSGQPWTIIAAPTPSTPPATPPSPAPIPATPTDAPAWSAGSVYTAGMTASVGGVVYKANWWTQGNDPSASSGPSGSGQPWTVVGPANPSLTPSPTPTPAPTPTPSPSDGTHQFAPYIDMSLYSSQNLAAIQAASGIKTFTLAFVLASGNGQVGWGGSGSIQNDTLPNGSSILSQIQTIRAAGADVIISFGGANGIEPALTAPNAAALQAMYQSVIDRYHPVSLDFDIEGGAVANHASLVMRDQALIGLKAANPGLTISFTLPVLPTGLDHNGLGVLQTAKADGLSIDLVNIMAMDYGPAVDNGGQMGADAISAATHTIEQMRFLGVDAKLGITPMIGVNDVASEIFTLADAQSLLDFARTTPDVERVSMWSVSRDNGSTAGSAWASPVGSGLPQSDYAFAHIFDHY